MEATLEITSITDAKSGLQWRIKPEGKFNRKDVIAKFGEPDVKGWRMPTVNDLRTLLVNPDVTSKLEDHNKAFWSASPLVDDYAWGVYSHDGSVINGGYRNLALLVRLVRASQ
jgi:hypothetical protein